MGWPVTLIYAENFSYDTAPSDTAPEQEGFAQQRITFAWYGRVTGHWGPSPGTSIGALSKRYLHTKRLLGSLTVAVSHLREDVVQNAG